MNKAIGIILIVASIFVGYLGFYKLNQSSESVNLLGIEFEASDKKGKQQAYLYLGGAIVLVAVGIISLNRRQSKV
jgi:hypothetical protein